MDPNDPNTAGADGERGLGTKILGGAAAGFAAKKFGNTGMFGTLAAAAMGAYSAEKIKSHVGKRDLNGNEIPEGAGGGYYDGAQSYGQQPPAYGQPQHQQYGTGQQQSGYAQASQYPSQPQYSKK